MATTQPVLALIVTLVWANLTSLEEWIASSDSFNQVDQIYIAGATSRGIKGEGTVRTLIFSLLLPGSKSVAYQTLTEGSYCMIISTFHLHLFSVHYYFNIYSPHPSYMPITLRYTSLFSPSCIHLLVSLNSSFYPFSRSYSFPFPVLLAAP